MTKTRNLVLIIILFFVSWFFREGIDDPGESRGFANDSSRNPSQESYTRSQPGFSFRVVAADGVQPCVGVPCTWQFPDGQIQNARSDGEGRFHFDLRQYLQRRPGFGLTPWYQHSVIWLGARSFTLPGDQGVSFRPSSAIVLAENEDLMPLVLALRAGNPHEVYYWRIDLGFDPRRFLAEASRVITGMTRADAQGNLAVAMEAWLGESLELRLQDARGQKGAQLKGLIADLCRRNDEALELKNPLALKPGRQILGRVQGKNLKPQAGVFLAVRTAGAAFLPAFWTESDIRGRFNLWVSPLVDAEITPVIEALDQQGGRSFASLSEKAQQEVFLN